MKWWVVIFLLLLPMANAGSVTVTFLPSTEQPLGKVLLQQIATIEGDASLATRLGSIPVTELERPGQVRRFGTATLRDFYVLPAVGNDTVDFQGMGSLEVKAVAAELGKDSLESLVRMQLIPMLANLPAGSWELDLSRLPAKIAVPTGSQWQPRMTVVGSFDARGQQTVEFAAMDGEKEVVRQRLMVTIRRFSQAAYSTREILKGEKLTPADVRFERLEITGVVRQVFSDMQALQGRQATRTIPRDRMISSSWLDKPYVVRRGERVQVSARLGGGGEISVPAQAEQDGIRGQIVALRNAESGLKMSARISEDGTLWAMP